MDRLPMELVGLAIASQSHHQPGTILWPRREHKLCSSWNILIVESQVVTALLHQPGHFRRSSGNIDLHIVVVKNSPANIRLRNIIGYQHRRKWLHRFPPRVLSANLTENLTQAM